MSTVDHSNPKIVDSCKPRIGSRLSCEYTDRGRYDLTTGIFISDRSTLDRSTRVSISAAHRSVDSNRVASGCGWCRGRAVKTADGPYVAGPGLVFECTVGWAW